MSSNNAEGSRRLVASLFGTLKLMQMYGARHDATGDALRNLTEAIHDAADSEGVTRVSVRGARLMVNERLMRASDCGNLALTFLAGEWSRRAVKAVRFDCTVDAADLSVFASAFLDLDTSRPDPAERLVSAVGTAGVTSIVIEAREHEEDDPIELEEQRETAMRAYLRGLRAFKEVLKSDGFKSKRSMRRARRAVQGLVDRFLENESAVIALAQIRGHDVKLFHHCLNVCIYSLALGQRLGMSRRQLGALGLAALFHDVGKTVASEPAEGASRWKELRAHPLRGARLLLDEGTQHEGMLKAAIAAFEHHAHYDGSGFPTLGHEPHLVSRIVAIADCYEALTSQRSYRDTPYTSYDALTLLHAKAGTLFDPLLLKVFANALGTFPVGSLVELTTGETAIVTAGPREAQEIGRPVVRIVNTGRGALPPDEVIDLCERSDETGEYPNVGIARPVPAHEIFENVGEYVGAI